MIVKGLNRRHFLISGGLTAVGLAMPGVVHAGLPYPLYVRLIGPRPAHISYGTTSFIGNMLIATGIVAGVITAGAVKLAYEYIFKPVDRSQVSSSTTYSFYSDEQVVTRESMLENAPPPISFSVSAKDPVPLEILSIHLASRMFAPDRARLDDNGGWLEIEPEGRMHFRDCEFEGFMVMQNNHLSVWDSSGGLVVNLTNQSDIGLVVCEESESAALALAALSERKMS